MGSVNQIASLAATKKRTPAFTQNSALEMQTYKETVPAHSWSNTVTVGEESSKFNYDISV